MEAGPHQPATGQTVTTEGIAPAHSGEPSFTAALIDPGRFYTHERCPATVSGRMLCSSWAGCPYCGFRGPWHLVPMGEPGTVKRTIIHGDPNALSDAQISELVNGAMADLGPQHQQRRTPG